MSFLEGTCSRNKSKYVSVFEMSLSREVNVLVMSFFFEGKFSIKESF